MQKCGGRSLKTDQGAKLTKLKLGVDRGGGVEYGNKWEEWWKMKWNEEWRSTTVNGDFQFFVGLLGQLRPLLELKPGLRKEIHHTND